MPVPIVLALQVTIASGCDFFPEEADLHSDIISSELSTEDFAISMSSIHDRLDLFKDKGTPYDSFNFDYSA